KRPLSMPIWAAHCLSFQAMLGIPYVLLPEDRGYRSSIMMLVYHTFRCMTSPSMLPAPLHWFAQSLNDLRSARNPAWPQRGGAHTLQSPRLAPLGDRRDIQRSAVQLRPVPNSVHHPAVLWVPLLDASSHPAGI